MPKKTASQSIGEIGVASITNLCTRAGWSVDQVYSDFGEDLVCQTGTKISRDHLIKWMCSPDLIILMFLAEEIGSGYYYTSDEKWRLSDIFQLSSTNVLIK